MQEAGRSRGTGPCIVGIGASAGGLEAIREMLGPARPSSDLAYVVIQHLDPTHESLLAELLGRQTRLEVLQAAGGEKVERGKVYIIPPGHGLSIRDGVLELTDFDQPRGLRRPIDDFFESLALDQGRLAVCVILSGTGGDGSSGLRAIKEHGGLCIAQDSRTARYDGMPHSAQATGLVDFVRAPDRIIETILQYHAHTALIGNGQLTRTVAESVGDICAEVQNVVGHDFSGYKTSTLVRRIERRIQVLGLSDPAQYLARIQADRDECETLFRELLINVTRFFRDPEQFEILRTRVIDPMVADPSRDEIRVWVPGCSSGEEAYSIAMLFADAMRRSGRQIRVQVFATDIDEQMLRLARNSVYPLAALSDIPERLRDAYTIGRDGRFQIAAALRDMVRFSVHGLVRDPPFSNIDLISCRNLLIYFGEGLQARALPVFHFALRPRGALFLGPSETVSRLESHFDPISPPARLYRRDDSRSPYPMDVQPDRLGQRVNAGSGSGADVSRAAAGGGGTLMSDRLLAAHVPAALQVSPTGEVLKTSGRLGRYLDFSRMRGEAPHAPSVAQPGLREAMSAAIRHVGATGRKAVTRDLTVRSEFGRQRFDLVAEPLDDGSILLVFRDLDRFEPADSDEYEDIEPSDVHVQTLEEELRATRARLHTTVEELETANEELKSSNEEMMSMNEELQSTNEELSTVNDELKSKIDELSVANADLRNFFASTALPLVVLDPDLQIRNYTDAVLSLYPFRATDRGRPLTDVTCLLKDSDSIVSAARQVIGTGTVQRLHVAEDGGRRRWALLITPYRTRSNRVDGATLVFTEITEALELEKALQEEGQRLRLAIEVAGLGIWEYDPVADELTLAEASHRLLDVAPSGSPVPVALFLRRVNRDDRPAVRAGLARLAEAGEMDLTFRLASGGVQPRSMTMVGRRTARSRRVGVIYDVTDAQEAVRIRETMLREMNHRVKNMFSIISGMVRLAGRQAPSVPELVDVLEERISALARSHALTQRGPDQPPVDLRDAVEAAIAPYADRTDIRVRGARQEVEARELGALSLMLHELATNAAKYGVLGPKDGQLDISWCRTPEGNVEFTWNETYDKRADLPEVTEAGFGTTLLRLSAAQLQGRMDVRAESTGRATRLIYEPKRQE